MLFHFQLHLKIYHWQTFSAPRHAASERLLSKLQEFTDDMVEFCQGRHETRLNVELGSTLKLRNVVEEGEDYGYELVRDLCKNIEELKCEDQAIDNKRQELLGEIERTLYLFTFQ